MNDFKLRVNKKLYLDDNTIIDSNFGLIENNTLLYKDKKVEYRYKWIEEKRNRDLKIIFILDDGFNIDEVVFRLENFNPINKRLRNKESTILSENNAVKITALYLVKEDKIYSASLDKLKEDITEIKEYILNCFDLSTFNLTYHFGKIYSTNDIDEFINYVRDFDESKFVYQTNLIYKNELDGSKRVYCPICNRWFEGSSYLFEEFKDDEKAIWLSNMVTHYRHTHITSWNKCWGYGGRFYRSGWFGDYDTEKQKVNERANRQIIRKAKDFLIENGFTSEDFKILKNTTEETMKLAIDKLDKVTK